MSYTITRENGQRDLEALKALLARDGIIDSDIDVLQELADSIEEQVKPAVEEPTGDVVVAPASGWFFKPGGMLGWIRDDLRPYTWQGVLEFGEPIVYRREERCITAADPEWHRLDVANAQTDAYAKGVEDFRTAALQAIREERASAISAVRQDAYDRIIKLIEGLRP